MRLEIRSVRRVDPAATGTEDALRIDGDRIVDRFAGKGPERTIDGRGLVAMTAGIDIHTHIGGGKANLARLLLYHRSAPRDRHALTSPVPPAGEAGRRYLQMGYTTCFEPAMLAAGARAAHCEMIDTPHLNTGGYVVLGNDEILLRRIAEGACDAEVRGYVGWMLAATQAMAVKVVNPAAVSALKYNRRTTGLDTPHPRWGITPREVLRRLASAVDELGLPHPLHVHCNDLGRRGNIATTLATVDAVEGRRIHLTHAQFHCYASEGPLNFSSAATELAARVNASPSLSIDVGQVMFGETATLSADVPHQFENRRYASPRRSLFQHFECQAGCGVVPFRYRHDQFVHGLQWAIGLELFLLVQNPWQIFLTTDHPNGGPFTSYPHLIKLLMDRGLREEMLDRLHPEVRNRCTLADLRREYTLEEVAILTRSGPARSLGLLDRVALTPGSRADIALYRRDADPERMFESAEFVIRDGAVVWERGDVREGTAKGIVRCPQPEPPELPRGFADAWRDHHLLQPAEMWVDDDELAEQGVRLERATGDVDRTPSHRESTAT